MDSIQIHEKNKNNVLMIVKLNVKKRQQIIPQKERENRGEIESGNSIVERKYIFFNITLVLLYSSIILGCEIFDEFTKQFLLLELKKIY